MQSTLRQPAQGDTSRLVLVLWAPGVGRGLARRVIECAGMAALGLPKGDVRVIHHCGLCGSSDHGRPLLTTVSGVAPVNLSISYAEDLTVVALTQAGAVGVDVERVDAAMSFAGLDAVVAHERERVTDMHTKGVTWVRKESLLKATGRGLTVDPRQIRMTAPDEPPELVAWCASDPPAGSVWVHDLEITSEHVAAVTVLGAAQRPPLAVKRADLAAQPR